MILVAEIIINSIQATEIKEAIKNAVKHVENKYNITINFEGQTQYNEASFRTKLNVIQANDSANHFDQRAIIGKHPELCGLYATEIKYGSNNYLLVDVEPNAYKNILIIEDTVTKKRYKAPLSILN